MPHIASPGDSTRRHVNRTSSPPNRDSLVIQDPWKPKIVLTFDGGGVRGFGSLLMLQCLMDEIKRQETTHAEPHDSSFGAYPVPMRSKNHVALPVLNGATTNPPWRSKTQTNDLTVSAICDNSSAESGPINLEGFLPCHYFDFIGGTSTGGLNAIMLGRLRMPVDQCISNYPTMTARIFANARLQYKGWPKSKYDAKQLQEAIDHIILSRNQKEKDRLKNFKYPDDLCRTFVVAKEWQNDNVEEPYIFRSYDNYGVEGLERPITHGPASEHQISAIGRATAAAPTYFKPMQIGEKCYSDGGIGFNNPAEVGYTEALHSESRSCPPIQENRPIPIHLFLSIGTGGDDDKDDIEENMNGSTQEEPEPLSKANKRKRRRKSFFFRHLHNLGDRLQKDVVDAKRVDKRMREKSREVGWDYFRWTGGTNLAKLKLDTWKTAKGGRTSTEADISDWIQTYMAHSTRKEEIAKIAKILVDARRERIAHDQGDRWQRYTYCSHLMCPVCGVKDHSKTGTKERLLKHLADDHNDQQYNINTWNRFAPKVDGGPW